MKCEFHSSLKEKILPFEIFSTHQSECFGSAQRKTDAEKRPPLEELGTF
jgi:hypothetical protein